MCLTVGRQSRDHRPLSRDPSVSFYKKFPNCLKRPKTLFDSQPTVVWPPTTVAWPFSDFFQNFPKSLETSKKRCLTVGRRSRDLRPLSRDRSATFFKIFPNCLKRLKNDVWQSADGRVTSDHCRVTVQRLFSKKFLVAWNVWKTLFDSRPTVAWPQPLSRDRSATFFKNFPNCFKRPRTLFDSRSDVRVTSVHCRVTPVTFFRVCFVRLLHTLAYVVFLVIIPSSAKSKATYLLLQEWSDPGNFDIISKLGIGRREFLILAGKFQLVDSPWGNKFPIFSAEDSREKPTELWPEVNTRENCRVNT